MQVAFHRPTLHAEGGGFIGALAIFLLLHASLKTLTPVAPEAELPLRLSREGEGEETSGGGLCPIGFQLNIEHLANHDSAIGGVSWAAVRPDRRHATRPARQDLPAAT